MQAGVKKKKKAKSGSVQVKASNSCLQLVFSFNGKRHYLSLGLTDTPFNRKQAQDKAFDIRRDIDYGQFDANDLDKYKTFASSDQAELTVPTEQAPALMEIWLAYFESKRSQLKPKTIEKYENFMRLFDKLGNLSIENALEDVLKGSD
ncbi:DUF3596 domain-containing protein [Leptolyngbya sp. CCNP1308]|uniref:Arm DNA-binding domain-containing protein n=1 Tax=Leptolyngbya sp. CCNP1308 TaxID=3110255 RepID=UPI002B1FFD24|nr:DUF3596 domain-containing protein [Leptolyngbya sp. CCNP1308]MEA5449702.1 DUF3596 domain-containing protein [Leptolyngbya sp. CCNP1308]